MRFFILFFLAIFLINCGGAPENSNSAANAVNNKPANAAASNANNPLATNRAPEAALTNDAPTLAPVVQNYYQALQKKDESAVRKYLSQSAIAYWQAEMKSEKMNSLLAILEDNESPVAEKREVRNEKIEGETAVAELRGGNLGVWTPYKFVRENGEWKFASPKESPALQGVQRTAPVGNQAK